MELLAFEGNIANGEVADWLRSELGIEAEPPKKNEKSRIVATYDYCDERGGLLFQVCRFDPKDFRQRRPDSRNGWEWKVKGTRQVPYLLPALVGAPADTLILIPEGEKDVDNLVKLGLVSTCNPGGAATAAIRSGGPSSSNSSAAAMPSSCTTTTMRVAIMRQPSLKTYRR
jgi:putative DNA primase/helicase